MWVYLFFFYFQDDLTGQAILDVAYARLNLIETAYFGLRFLDEENQTVSDRAFSLMIWDHDFLFLDFPKPFWLISN